MCFANTAVAVARAGACITTTHSECCSLQYVRIAVYMFHIVQCKQCKCAAPDVLQFDINEYFSTAQIGWTSRLLLWCA